MGLIATHPHDRVWPDLEPFGLATPWLSRQLRDTCGGSTAIVDGGHRLAWRDVHDMAEAVAELMATHGVVGGDVVTVQLPNWWETVVVALAAWRLGAVLNPVTPIYRGSELRTIFDLAQPRLVLYPGRFGEVDYGRMTAQALRDAGITAVALPVRGEGPADTVIPRGDLVDPVLPDLADLSVDEVSILMFTSGTTGRPKGVLHSQRTLLYESASIAHRFQLEAPRIFMPSPLTHITGLLYGILLPVLTRGGVVLQDRWDPARAVDLIEDEYCTFCVGATPFLGGLVDEYRRRDQGSMLESFVCGGADVPPTIIEDADRVMGTLAVRAYGLTELPTLTCGSPSDPVMLRSADDGLLIGSSQARIVDVDGDMGDLEARGPEMFLGYLDPADNVEAFTSDGWFRTGDVAQIEQDRVRIVGRRKDIIVRGGENLSPAEVEAVMRELPSVLDVAIVGVPDATLGERACAMVVADGAPPTLAEVRAALDAHDLARQKAPEHLLVCESLPRTPSGKIQKYLLRQWARERLAAGEGESR